MSEWIGVDFDGTLATEVTKEYDGPLGDPIPRMINRIKGWLDQGTEVRILTARMSPRDQNGFPQSELGLLMVKQRIEDWCEKHLGQKLKVTCEKDHGMIRLWDDKAIGVIKNTGERVG